MLSYVCVCRDDKGQPEQPGGCCEEREAGAYHHADQAADRDHPAQRHGVTTPTVGGCHQRGQGLPPPSGLRPRHHHPREAQGGAGHRGFGERPKGEGQGDCQERESMKGLLFLLEASV